MFFPPKFNLLFQISLSLETAIDDWMSTGIGCFHRLSNDTTPTSAKFFDDKATLVDAKNVDCGKVWNVPGNLYQVGLVFAPQVKSIS